MNGPDKTRRTELGKMALDIAKFTLTIVVIGGAFFEQLNPVAVVLGIVLAVVAATIGFHVIPLEGEKK